MAIPPTSNLTELRHRVTGPVIAAGDAGYDKARTVVAAAFDRHPLAIVRVADATDVSRVVTFARETGLELAVRSGGHSGAGHGTCDGGIVLDLSAMKGLEIDPEGRTAWAEAGLTAGEYTARVAEHGLATGFGDTGSVGIGGITVGGGIGYLVRRYGLTIDALLAAEIVTADGELLHVDAASHPDLFWAIRGGGGNFGVATRFTYRLYEVGSIIGGMLIQPATADVIAGFLAAAEAAPEELSTIANVMPCPPMPFVPEEHHGSLVVMSLICWAGDEEEGQRALAPFRALATPIADMLRSISYPEIYPPENPDYRPVAVARTGFLEGVDRDTAQTIIDTLGTSTAQMPVAQLRVLGGAMARVPADATAFAHRDARILVNLAALYDPTTDTAAPHVAWVEEFMRTLTGGNSTAYVNFLADEGLDRVRDAYPPATWQRLTEIKDRYDPTNLFHLNQNIPPDR